MIPKIIHYCWFGRGLMPASQKEYIRNWSKIMSGYQIKCWDESNFDVHSNEYVSHAYQHKKYAYVSDYARLKALYNEGGFYMDTDVELFKSFDDLTYHKFVSAVEYFNEFENFKNLLNKDALPKVTDTIIPYLGFLTAFIGSEPKNHLIKDMLNFYDSITPGHSDFKGTVIDGIMAREAVKYGFRYKDEFQQMEQGMVIYPSGLFCSMPDQVNTDSYLLHKCAQSWQPKTKNQQIQLQLDKLNLLKIYKFFTGLKRKIF